MTEYVEFGSLASADRVRDEYSDYVCPVDDDKRLKTVAFISDTPEGTLQAIEADAAGDKAAAESTSETADLSERERERIKDADGFGDGVSIFNWQSAKGSFQREGLTEEFYDAIGNLSDGDDPIERAESWLREHQQQNDMGGSAIGGGSGQQDEGTTAEQQRRSEQRAAAIEQTEGCNHAAGACRHGKPEACEYLTEACGYSEDEVDDILGSEADADEAEGGDGDATPEAIEGKAAGALARSWGGYRGAIADLATALENVREEWSNATDAAEAINAIRDDHNQDPIHFEALERANAELLDLLRKAAAGCEECHADHSDHDHAVTSGQVENIRTVVRDGAAATPVGTNADTDAVIADPESDQPTHDALEGDAAAVERPTDADLAAREPERPADVGGDTDPMAPTMQPTPNRDADAVAGVPIEERRRDLEGTGLAPSDLARDEPGERAIVDDATDADRFQSEMDRIAAMDEAQEDMVDVREDVQNPDFAPERQGTLGVDVEADAEAQNEQVTLTGEREGDDDALPAAWRREGSTWVAGPYRVQLDSHDGDRWNVRLYGDDHRFDVAKDVRSASSAEAIGQAFVDRVAPTEVSFHSGDSAVPDAAAAAKNNVDYDSGPNQTLTP